ncbi:MAG: hypothetical protein AAF654_06270 [Myxococcota bacterium]
MRFPPVLARSLLLCAAGLAWQCSDDDETESPEMGQNLGAGPSDADLDLAIELSSEVATRRGAGESFEAIGQALQQDPRVQDVQWSGDALRYVLPDGLVRWRYQADGPGIDPEDIPSAPAFNSQASGSAPGQNQAALVFRDESQEDRADEKSALLLAPFRFQFGDELASWNAKLNDKWDYRNRSSLVTDGMVGDEEFSNWDNYRLIIISTHGGTVNFTSDDGGSTRRTILFSSVPCGLSQWIDLEIQAGRGGAPTRDTTRSVASYLGAPLSETRAALTEAQLASAEAFEKQNEAQLNSNGRVCSALEIPGKSGGMLEYKVLAYDESWFLSQPKVGDTLLYVASCSGNALNINIFDDFKPWSYVSWNEDVEIDGEIAAQTTFLTELIDKGKTAEQATNQVIAAGQSVVNWTKGKRMITAEFGFAGDPNYRIREIVRLTRPGMSEPLRGDFQFPEPVRPIDGDTGIELGVEIDLQDVTNVDAYRFSIENGADGFVLFQPTRPADPDPDGVSRFDVRFDIGEGTMVVPLVARVTLPDDEGSSVHPVVIELQENLDPDWTVNVGGLVASGDAIEIPLAVAPAGGAWSILLQQRDAFAGSSAILNLSHPGRGQNCIGPTGPVDAEATVVVEGGITGPFFATDDECGAQLTATVNALSREDGLSVTLAGTICRTDIVANELVTMQVAMGGSFTVPDAGCGEAQGAFVGSFDPVEFICTDVYSGALQAATFESTCNAGLSCSPSPCAPGIVGTCDYRFEGAIERNRDTVVHYAPDPEVDPADLQSGCVAEGGTWTAGP